MATNFVFCTKCAQQNPATNEICSNCENILTRKPPPPPPAYQPLQHTDPSSIVLHERENKIKASTVILVILGIVLPAWIITLPLCWYFAYRSYKQPWSF